MPVSVILLYFVCIVHFIGMCSRNVLWRFTSATRHPRAHRCLKMWPLMCAHALIKCRTSERHSDHPSLIDLLRSNIIRLGTALLPCVYKRCFHSDLITSSYPSLLIPFYNKEIIPPHIPTLLLCNILLAIQRNIYSSVLYCNGDFSIHELTLIYEEISAFGKV